VSPAIALVCVFAPMLLEARLSVAHERALRLAGAREPHDDVYPLMQMAYPAAFIAMITEGFARAVHLDRLVVAGVVVFLAAKALKYWAISSLGSRWTFRVLVPPGSSSIMSGPYRWLRHPNYIAVAFELAGVAIAMHAWYTGVPAVAGFVFLIVRRIAIEERALGRI
jgi:methyltransferase